MNTVFNSMANLTVTVIIREYVTCCRWPISRRQPAAVRLRAAVAGPMAAPVAPGSRAGPHAGHGRDAVGPVDGPAGHVRRLPKRRGSGPSGRYLPGGLAVQGERP